MAQEGTPAPSQSALTNKLINELELLERHVAMLKTIQANEPIGIIRLSEQTGLPQHKVRYSLRILEAEGLIEPSSDGALTTNKVQPFFGELSKTLDQMVQTIENLKKLIVPTQAPAPAQEPPAQQQ